MAEVVAEVAQEAHRQVMVHRAVIAVVVWCLVSQPATPIIKMIMLAQVKPRVIVLTVTGRVQDQVVMVGPLEAHQAAQPAKME
jgi:hypothetical protein